MPTKSFMVSVRVKGTATMVNNGLRFADVMDADRYGADLALRWPAVTRHDVIPSDDPPNCTYPVPSDRYPVNRPAQDDVELSG